MPSQDLMPDRLGSYRLLKRIGEGGMGVVFLARSPGQSSVALKVLRSTVAGEPIARRRLAREVETMQRVRSPYVAEVIDADLQGDMPYIVTRYVPGRTLDEVVSEGGPIAGAALARLAGGLAEALVAVHAAGVVHRDLKPSNVMLLDGSPVVIDFGIAQGPDATRLTLTGMFMGTPGYLAPEVIEGRPSSQASDVHAWGATVAFAATGYPPYGTGPYEGIFYRIVNGRPDLAAVPRPLLPLLSSALARDPAHRPSAVQLAAQVSVLDPAGLTPPPVMPAAAPGLAARPGQVTREDAAPAGAAAAFGAAAPVGAGAAGAAAPAGVDAPAGAAAPAGVGAPMGFGPPVGLGSPAGPADGLTAVPPGPGVPAGPLTRPLAAGHLSPDDLARLLPPVQYQPGGAASYPPAALAPWSSRLPDGRAAAGPAARPRSSRLLVLASMVAAASTSVILPIVGTAASLALVATLRAAGLAQQRNAQRRLARGSRPSNVFLATVSFPWLLLRALLAMLLLSPFALAVAALVAGIIVVAAPAERPARALAYAAGALVLFYGLGPGSRTARTQLKRAYTAVASTRGAYAAATAAVAALALAVTVAALSWPSVYWPALAPARFLHIWVIHLGPHHFQLLRFGLSRRIVLLRRLVLHHLGQLG